MQKRPHCAGEVVQPVENERSETSSRVGSVRQLNTPAGGCASAGGVPLKSTDEFIDVDRLPFPRLDGLMVDVAPMATIEKLLEILSEYLELEDTDCLTLPPAAYRLSDLYELEIEKIFKKSWLCVGRAEYVSDPGDYYVFDLLGDMLVIVHGEDGEIHALSNVLPAPLHADREGFG